MNLSASAQARFLAAMRDELAALSSQTETPKPKTVYKAAEIRALYLADLDNGAIASITGAKIATVRMVTARFRKRQGLPAGSHDSARSGILIRLPDDLRGKLQIEANRRRTDVNGLVNQFLERALREGLLAGIVDGDGVNEQGS